MILNILLSFFYHVYLNIPNDFSYGMYYYKYMVDVFIATLYLQTLLQQIIKEKNSLARENKSEDITQFLS
jgi:hypothetical protein